MRAAPAQRWICRKRYPLVDRDNNGTPINNTRRMVLRKLRDGTDEGRVIPYRLQVVDMGKDEDGDPITTCVMRWEPGRTLNKPQRGDLPATTGH